MRHGFADNPITFTRLLVRHEGSLRGLLSIACHLMYGGSHFVHGSGHLVGFDLLVVDPGAGLLGYRRKLFGGAGDLRDTVTDTTDQFAQALGHALHAGLQLPQLVAAGCQKVLAQVAVGHALGGGQCLAQRDDDLPGDGPGREQAEHQRQCRG
ncbi:hypothetical protein D3C81_1681890 [compost metagenome]